MLHILLIVGVVFVVLLLGFLAFAATRPADFQVERSAVLQAPAEAVFPLINDFHQWARWSPFEKLDPAMKKTFEGPAAGPGSVYSWDGNSRAGAGRTTILESSAGELVALKLEMFRPFRCENQVRFELTPHGPGAGATRVRWLMSGQNGFMSKAFSVICNMDKMVGKEFEKGLASMESAAQADVKNGSQSGHAAGARENAKC